MTITVESSHDPIKEGVTSIHQQLTRPFYSWVWLIGDEYGTATDFPRKQQGWQSTLLLFRELTFPLVNNDLVKKEQAPWRVIGDSTDDYVTLETRNRHHPGAIRLHETIPKRSARGSDFQAGFRIL